MTSMLHQQINMKRFFIKLAVLLLALAATYALSSAQNQTAEQLNSNADSSIPHT